MEMNAATVEPMPISVRRRLAGVAAVGLTLTALVGCTEQGISYFRLGAGHVAIAAFNAGCPDPRNPKNNHKFGSNQDTENHYLPDGNPDLCALDASSLAITAINNSLDKNVQPLLVRDIAASKLFKTIPASQAEAGDFGLNDNTNIEIIDHMEGDKAHSIGAHHSGMAIGPAVGVFQEYRRFIG